MTKARYDRHGKLTAIVWARRHVMVRRPSQFPFVLTKLDWNKLSSIPIEKGAAVYPIVSHDTDGRHQVNETFLADTVIETPPDGWKHP